MKRIVIINQSAGHITRDIARAFSRFFNSIVIITGSAGHFQNASKDKNKILKISSYKRHNSIARLSTWFIGFAQIFSVIMLKYNHSYLFITSNPPFAPFLPLLCDNRFSILIYDIYPDILVQHKICTKSSLLVRLWEKTNTILFRKADYIFVLSEGMKQVVSRYGCSEKVKKIPLWFDGDSIRPVSKDHNAFIETQGLRGKFIILYSGNLGFTHDASVILDLASEIRLPEVLFVIIGDGDQKKYIQKQVKHKSLTNCMICDYQPIEMLSHSLSSADLALVTLGKEASRLSVPSKTFNLMAVGVPILGVAEKESELATLIDTHKLGRCYTRAQVSDMVVFILSLIEDKRHLRELKQNCLEAARLYSPTNADLYASYIYNTADSGFCSS